jgi:uncharacterized protein YndB with AHSA1/START domain
MVKIIVVIAVLLAVAVVGILIFATTKPDTIHVQREIDINAPAEKVFALINDFHGWPAWSPYEKKDPEMKRSYSGAASGKGAVYEWDGNKNVGKGRMEITDVTPPSRTIIKLDFISPFEGHNVATFTTTPRGDSTHVTWAMDGPAAFITKIMQVFCDLDKMIGADFGVGLQNLKALAEK